MANHGFKRVFFESVLMPTNRARKRVIAAGNDPDDVNFYDPRQEGGDLVVIRPSTIRHTGKNEDPNWRRAGSGGPR
jgi:hypothetical protein